ncbi:MAG TPA: hypothetical protein VMM79_09685 [Longimicrobiales bacterium]|nr:hypothetical protein [Longimicrobiales bacterium]
MTPTLLAILPGASCTIPMIHRSTALPAVRDTRAERHATDLLLSISATRTILL